MDSKIGTIGSVVGKGLFGDVQDFGPFCPEIASEGISHVIRFPILGNCKPNLVKVANGNESARDDSPGFIEIDRAGIETLKNSSFHCPKYHKLMARSDLKYP